MSKIEWTQKTWNPTTGCTVVSPGCKNCYAEVMTKRLQVMGQAKYANGFKLTVHPAALTLPLTWKKGVMIFVNSMSDLFHKDVPFEFIDQVFAIMALTPQHTYQILTKRADRMEEYWKYPNRMAYIMSELDSMGENPDMFELCCDTASRIAGTDYLPNVQLGVSVEDQKRADERIPPLLRTPAAVRFLSGEPLLGPLDLERTIDCKGNHEDDTSYSWLDSGIHWVIAGGESGHGARPMHPDWVRSIRDQCASAGVPFFFKQWGEYGPECHMSAKKTQAVCVGIDGKVIQYPAGGADVDMLPASVTMYKNGKSKSGSLLDGVAHKEFPKQENQNT